MSLQNQNSEKYDLYKLIHSLNSNELRKVRAHLNSSENKKSSVYKELFELVKRQSKINEEELKTQLNISNEKFRDTKFYLIKFVLDCLKKNLTRYSKLWIHEQIIELRLLTEKGLYKKALKKFKTLKQITIVRHDFVMTCDLLKLREALTLFEASEDEVIQKRLKKNEEINHFLMLAKNLNDYSSLSIKVLGLGYEVSGSHSDQKKALFDFLDRPLLKDESNAKSDLAKYLYLESKCLIYMGINNYEKAQEYSLKCWIHLNEIQTPYRNDNHLILTSLSNYLHSVLILKDFDAYHKMAPHFEKIVEEKMNRKSNSQKAKAFEMHSSVLLTYYGTTNKYDEFIKIYPELNDLFESFKNIIHPNFKASIIYCIARLFFIGGNFEKSLEWSDKLQDIQRLNPFYTMLVCNNILRIMIHFELGNLITIPYLSNNAKYFIKSKNRYYELERCFIKGISKVKAFHTRKQKQEVFEVLLNDLETLLKDDTNRNISLYTGITEWVRSKVVTS